MLSTLFSYMHRTKQDTTNELRLDMHVKDYVWSTDHKMFIIQAKQLQDEKEMFIQTVYTRPLLRRRKQYIVRKNKALPDPRKRRPRFRSGLCDLLEYCIYI